MDSASIPLWSYLVQQVESDADGFVERIANNKGFDKSLYASKVYLGCVDMDIDTGFEMSSTFLFEAHRRLCSDHGVACQEPWQSFIQRIRKVINIKRIVEVSQVHLVMSPLTQMGGGLNPSPLTILPDPSRGVEFGSQPDQEVIAAESPCWEEVKKRRYLSETMQLGAKPHYVLAHLVNHNLNGSGRDKLNLVPLWANANTEMGRVVEKALKDAVFFGFQVTYSIVLGPPMKNDATYSGWFDLIMEERSLSAEHLAVIVWEQELPQFLTIQAHFEDAAGTRHDLLGGAIPIKNFVPMMVPDLLKPMTPKNPRKKK